MAETILLVFEGGKTEPNVFDNIQESFFHSDKSAIIYTTYNAEIYQLWKCVRDDEYLDLLEVLKERDKENKTCLAGVSRDDVSQIFLFFDYEGHASNASDDAIAEMLVNFDEETDNGKLYISYPMVEAYKDIVDDFKSHIVPAKENVKYKKMSAESSPYKDPRKIDIQDWRKIISENLKKGNFIVNGEYTIPSFPLSQTSVFDGQLAKFIKPFSKVAVLSGIPFFIDEYFEEFPIGLDK